MAPDWLAHFPTGSFSGLPSPLKSQLRRGRVLLPVSQPAAPISAAFEDTILLFRLRLCASPGLSSSFSLNHSASHPLPLAASILPKASLNCSPILCSPFIAANPPNHLCVHLRKQCPQHKSSSIRSSRSRAARSPAPHRGPDAHGRPRRFMFWCCCLRLHRHQLHLVSYGCVSLSLIITGVVFTVFAVFQKDSQIGKVWLAGPVLIVVGAVLCGKVMIDWGPAMERGRAGSVDSRLVDEFGYSNLLSVSGPTKTINLVGRSPEMAQHLKIPVKNSSAGLPPGNTSPLSQVRSLVSPSFSNSAGGQFGPYDCITYGPSPEMPASPCRSSSERREMADKMTQAKEESCEKCATLWAILDRRKTGPPEAAARSPKVIGRFVFSELNNGGPSQQQQQPMANYGAALGESTSSSLQNNHHHHVPHSRQMPAAPRRGTRKKSYAQGETMIMNERSFLI